MRFTAVRMHRFSVAHSFFDMMLVAQELALCQLLKDARPTPRELDAVTCRLQERVLGGWIYMINLQVFFGVTYDTLPTKESNSPFPLARLSVTLMFASLFGVRIRHTPSICVCSARLERALPSYSAT